MSDLIITRDFKNDTAVIGRYVLDGRTYHTMENIHTLIEAQLYLCERDMYYGGDGVGGKRDYPCFELRGVTGKTEVKFHIANYPHQLAACIAPGMARDEDIPAVWSSGTAFGIFMKYFDGVDSFELEIVEDF